MRSVEMEGKSVTMAVERGLAELGLRRDQVEVQVVQEAAPGFLGIGTKPARVRITEKIWGAEEQSPEGSGRPPKASKPHPADPSRGYAPTRTAPRPTPRPESDESQPPERTARETIPIREPHLSREPRAREAYGGRQPRGREHSRTSAPRQAPKPPVAAPPADTGKACEEAKALLAELFKAIGLTEAKITAGWDAAQLRVRAEVETPDDQLLIGKDGKTLESFQFLVTLMLSRRLKTPVAVQVETQGYWQQKEESILTVVHQAIEEVKRTGKLVRLAPMEASIRRMVHRSLAQSPDVETVSEGEGSWRKIILRPKKR